MSFSRLWESYKHRPVRNVGILLTKPQLKISQARRLVELQSSAAFWGVITQEVGKLFIGLRIESDPKDSTEEH